MGCDIDFAHHIPRRRVQNGVPEREKEFRRSGGAGLHYRPYFAAQHFRSDVGVPEHSSNTLKCIEVVTELT